MDVTRARALVRLERACAQSDPFARAYRSGALSSVKASRLVPLVLADPLGTSVAGWVEWAGRTTVRRLDDDVERALALAETQPVEFARTGGLPAEAHDFQAHDSQARDSQAHDSQARDSHESRLSPDREIGAPATGPEADTQPDPDREIGAPETCWARFIGPPDVVQLFKAVLCTVRRRIERETGKLPTSGEGSPSRPRLRTCFPERRSRLATGSTPRRLALRRPPHSTTSTSVPPEARTTRPTA